MLGLTDDERRECGAQLRLPSCNVWAGARDRKTQTARGGIDGGSSDLGMDMGPLSGIHVYFHLSGQLGAIDTGLVAKGLTTCALYSGLPLCFVPVRKRLEELYATARRSCMALPANLQLFLERGHATERAPRGHARWQAVLFDFVWTQRVAQWRSHASADDRSRTEGMCGAWLMAELPTALAGMPRCAWLVAVRRRLGLTMPGAFVR